jgi:hypothetical protein
MNIPRFWLEASHRRKRIYSFMFMFLLAVLAIVVGALVPVNPIEAQMISEQLNKTVTQGTANGTLIPDIFLNNFSLCLLMFVPLAGAGLGLFIMFSTGQAFRAVFDLQVAGGLASASSAASNISLTTAIIALAGFAAVFLLEFVCYAIAMSESVWLSVLVLRVLGHEKQAVVRFKKELIYLGIGLVVVAVLLLVGAVVETPIIGIEI